jgi:RNA polymerase sigma factor (sigma-70 family)
MKIFKDNDVNTWRMFKQGDDDAFSAIYSQYSKKLYFYGLKITRNHSIIEDTLQDLFFELIRTRKSIGETDNILRYLLTSFRRKLFRKLKSENRYDLRDEAVEYPFEVMYSIEHEMVLDENRNRRNLLFVNALQQLSPRQKEAIYLKFTSGLAYEEVSGIMEMSLEACRNLIYRAIKALKEGIHEEK